MMYLTRTLEAALHQYAAIFPVVAILGPRQCGKSTLVKKMFEGQSDFIYLDLQNDEDLNKLNDPRLFFRANTTKTICLDEVQRLPEIFSVLRSIVDENRRNGRFILTGSASPDLIRQSAESLAGRIGYLELNPFTIIETPNLPLLSFWNRGGFPNSALAADDSSSYVWRQNFVRTYVERDIPMLGFQIPALQIRRFLTILAHQQGQIINLSKMGGALDMTHPTIKRYIDLLEQTFIVRTLPALELNIKKRLVKSPKVYIRDVGLLHYLLGIKNQDALFSHPVFGASWEGLVIEQILSNCSAEAFFYRSSTGDEMDLVLVLHQKKIAIECKAASAPQPTKGFYNAIEAIQPDITYIVAPINANGYALSSTIRVVSLAEIILLFQNNEVFK